MINIATYTGLVHKVARRYTGMGIEYEELIGMGLVGLQEAAVKHNSAKGALGTIAPYYIKAQITNAIRKNKVYFNTYAQGLAMDIDTGRYYESDLPVDLSDNDRESITTPDYESPENLAFNQIDGEKVKSAVDRLSDRRKQVILERYFNEGLAKSRHTVAKEMGISHQRVAEIEKTALRDLRKILGI